MEIHHHPHSPRQKFSHYLYEFFMFFLAVTASFCVENWREHYIEQERAKQFAQLLIDDLSKDIDFYKETNYLVSTLQRESDSLSTALLSMLPQSGEGSLSKLLHLSDLYDIQVNTATYSEMKSSGSLRYFKDPQLLSRLQEYYEIQVPKAVKWSEGSNTFFTEYMHTSFSNDGLIDQRQVNIMQNYHTYLSVLAQQLYRPSKNQAEHLVHLLETEYTTN